MMKAAIFRSSGKLSVEEIDYPKLPDDGLIIKVDACGICGSDLRTLRYGFRFNIDWQILGHEIAGTVFEVGSKVTNFCPGDRIAIAADVHCHNCYYCLRGLYNMCSNLQLIGTHFAGGFAEYMLLTKEILSRGVIHSIPSNVSSIHAALAEPASSVLNTQKNSCIGLSDIVLIIGAGPMGCLHAEIANIRGAFTIIADISKVRLNLARRFNLNHYINSSQSDLISEVMTITNGLGADVVIVACPSAEAQAQAIQITRKQGRVILFGGLPKDDPITHLNANLIHYGEIMVVGAFSYHPSQHKVALDLISTGKIKAAYHITNTYPLSNIEEAMMVAMEGSSLKVVILPQEG